MLTTVKLHILLNWRMIHRFQREAVISRESFPAIMHLLLKKIPSSSRHRYLGVHLLRCLKFFLNRSYLTRETFFSFALSAHFANAASNPSIRQSKLGISAKFGAFPATSGEPGCRWLPLAAPGWGCPARCCLSPAQHL